MTARLHGARYAARERFTALAAIGLPLVLLLTACASSSNGPAKLALQSLGKRDAAAMAAGGYYSGFVLDGTLPTGPANGQDYVWKSDASVTADQVSALGKAFGVSGTPQRHPYGWSLKSAVGEVRVRDGAGGQWQYVSAASSKSDPCLVANLDIDSASPDGTVSSCATSVPVPGITASSPTSGPDSSGSGSGSANSAGTSTSETVRPSDGSGSAVPGSSPTAKPEPSGTPVPVPSGTPVPGPSGTPIPVDQPVVPADVIHALADPVLKSLGLVGKEVVTPGLGTGYAQVDPTVAGLPTSGISTTITVSRTDVITASGWVTPPTPGDSYPLISAADAFKQLTDRPVPAIGMPCVSPTDGTSGCASPSPTVITGAVLGLQLDFTQDSEPLLVPAWLFTAKDEDFPIGQIAVDPSYLTTPTPTGSAGTGTGGSGGSSGASTGSGGTPVDVIPPNTPGPGPALTPDTLATPAATK